MAPGPDFKINGYVVAQFPNPPLIVALLATLVSAVVSSGSVADGARSIFYVALAIWAYEEAANGVNGFRRVLGVAGLIFVVVRVAQGFG